MLDILDKLENERGCVLITLTSGRTVLGYTDIIVWLEDDEDDEGMEISKAIWVKPYSSNNFIALKLEEVQAYEVVEETDLPPCE